MWREDDWCWRQIACCYGDGDDINTITDGLCVVAVVLPVRVKTLAFTSEPVRFLLYLSIGPEYTTVGYV